MTNAPGEVIKMFMNNEVNKEVLKTTTEGSQNFLKSSFQIFTKIKNTVPLKILGLPTILGLQNILVPPNELSPNVSRNIIRFPNRPDLSPPPLGYKFSSF